MKLSLDWRNSKDRFYLVQLVRAVPFLMVLSIGVVSSIAHEGFANWSVLGPFYGVLALGFFFAADNYFSCPEKSAKPFGVVGKFFG